MTKELEMTNIEFLKEHIEQLKEVLFVDDLQPALVKSVELELTYWGSILKDLLELQSIKEAKPSEALECIDYIENKLGSLRVECEKHHNHNCDDLFIQESTFNTIKQALLKAEKLEKAWEVVKEKSLANYEKVIIKKSKDYNEYRNMFHFVMVDGIAKNKEEYDLLKEVLE